jgi:hypothetical protein
MVPSIASCRRCKSRMSLRRGITSNARYRVDVPFRDRTQSDVAGCRRRSGNRLRPCSSAGLHRRGPALSFLYNRLECLEYRCGPCANRKGFLRLSLLACPIGRNRPLGPANREHIIALESLSQGLMGTLLRQPYEVRSENDYFDDAQDVKVTKICWA